MSFTTSMKTTATTLLRSMGELVTATRVVEGSYDTTTGSVAVGNTYTYDVYAAPMQYNASEIDGDLIKNGDIRLITQVPTSYTPAVGDTIVLNSKGYRVMSVLSYRAQGADCAYVLQLRI